MSYRNIKESLDMINFIDQRNDIQFTCPLMSSTITRSYPTFTLFSEQVRDQTLVVTATRFYTKKAKIFYISVASSKNDPNCQKMC